MGHVSGRKRDETMRHQVGRKRGRYSQVDRKRGNTRKLGARGATHASGPQAGGHTYVAGHMQVVRKRGDTR